MGRHRICRADGKLTLLQLAQAAQTLLPGRQHFQACIHIIQQQFALRRQGDAPPPAHQQRMSQTLLQLGHCLTHGRLADV